MIVNTDYGHSDNLSEETIYTHLPGGQPRGVQGGGEQEPVAFKKRWYNRKLKGGQSRNGIKQLNIRTFAVSKILGGDLTKTETDTEGLVSGGD